MNEALANFNIRNRMDSQKQKKEKCHQAVRGAHEQAEPLRLHIFNQHFRIYCQILCINTIPRRRMQSGNDWDLTLKRLLHHKWHSWNLNHTTQQTTEHRCLRATHTTTVYSWSVLVITDTRFRGISSTNADSIQTKVFKSISCPTRKIQLTTLVNGSLVHGASSAIQISDQNQAFALLLPVQEGHLYCLMCSALAGVILTHLPWNHVSHKSQQIQKSS